MKYLSFVPLQPRAPYSWIKRLVSSPTVSYLFCSRSWEHTGGRKYSKIYSESPCTCSCSRRFRPSASMLLHQKSVFDSTRKIKVSLGRSVHCLQRYCLLGWPHTQTNCWDCCKSTANTCRHIFFLNLFFYIRSNSSTKRLKHIPRPFFSCAQKSYGTSLGVRRYALLCNTWTFSGKFAVLLEIIFI